MSLEEGVHQRKVLDITYHKTHTTPTRNAVKLPCDHRYDHVPIFLKWLRQQKRTNRRRCTYVCLMSFI